MVLLWRSTGLGFECHRCLCLEDMSSTKVKPITLLWCNSNVYYVVGVDKSCNVFCVLQQQQQQQQLTN